MQQSTSSHPSTKSTFAGRLPKPLRAAIFAAVIVLGLVLFGFTGADDSLPVQLLPFAIGGMAWCSYMLFVPGKAPDATPAEAAVSTVETAETAALHPQTRAASAKPKRGWVMVVRSAAPK